MVNAFVKKLIPLRYADESEVERPLEALLFAMVVFSFTVL